MFISLKQTMITDPDEDSQSPSSSVNESLASSPEDLSEEDQSSDYSSVDNASTSFGLSWRAVRDYDVEVNGLLSRREIQRFVAYSLGLLALGAPIVYLLLEHLPEQSLCSGEESMDDSESGAQCNRVDLIGNIALMFGLFVVFGISAGIVAVKTHVKIGYTRKVLHFCSFFLPFAVNKLLPVQAHYSITLLKFWLILFVLLLAAKSIRRWFWPAAIIFRAIDRPEDRPDTLKWLSTQYIASAAVAAGFSALFDDWETLATVSNISASASSSLDIVDSVASNRDDLMLILVLINGLGDGLAEPVGIRFGGRLYSKLPWIGKWLGKYHVRAWRRDGECCGGSYTRSWEGSTMVFLVTLISLLALGDAFNTGRWIAALITMPPLMVATEALSPRTWDSPFLFAIGGALLVLYLWPY